MSEQQLDRLQQYSACDISDALLKLEKVKDGGRVCAGFLADIVPRAGWIISRSHAQTSTKVIAPAFTVQFQPKSPCNGGDVLPKASTSNIEPGTQWSDLIPSGTVAVVQQPEGQRCAVLGGIHALNIDRRGAKGVIVLGRIRDLQELQQLTCPIWSLATSTVGASAESKAYATQVPLEQVGGVTIKPGDIMFCDTAEGVVVIPLDLLDDVLNFLPGHVKAEEGIKYAVKNATVGRDTFMAGLTPLAVRFGLLLPMNHGKNTYHLI
ncbi:hypothetical protein MMC13_005252 [Lambiella insularis]|nr:hypothetical protein [Lambiella insularis]